MDVTKWAMRIRELYADLMDQDHSRMTDIEFTRTMSNLLPTTNDGWRSFLSRLRRIMDKADENGKPISSSKLIEMIREEDYSQHANDPERMAVIYGTEGLVRKRSAVDANLVTSAASAKRPRDDRNTRHCDNPSCGRPNSH